jgi:hypothetical protein
MTQHSPGRQPWEKVRASARLPRCRRPSRGPHGRSDILNDGFEVSGAVGILIPKYRFWAALQLATVMVGATVTNIAILHLRADARVTAILLLLTLTLAWLRRPRRLGLAMA